MRVGEKSLRRGVHACLILIQRYFDGNNLVLPKSSEQKQTSADESAALAKQVAEAMNLRAGARR